MFQRSKVQMAMHQSWFCPFNSTHVGHGESSLVSASSALKDGFNGRAVDHVSFVLKDLQSRVHVA